MLEVKRVFIVHSVFIDILHLIAKLCLGCNDLGFLFLIIFLYQKVGLVSLLEPGVA
jgi:hypothetical protein